MKSKRPESIQRIESATNFESIRVLLIQSSQFIFAKKMQELMRNQTMMKISSAIICHWNTNGISKYKMELQFFFSFGNFNHNYHQWRNDRFRSRPPLMNNPRDPGFAPRSTSLISLKAVWRPHLRHRSISGKVCLVFFATIDIVLINFPG